MPKSKANPEAQFFTAHDRLPHREAIVTAISNRFADLAEFYGFKKIATSVVEDAKPFAALMKGRFFDERAPIMWRTRTGQNVLLRISGALSILRGYLTQKMNDLPHPLKFFFRGESFFERGTAGPGPAVPAYQTETVEECGVFFIGEEGPIAEAEVIHLIWRTLEEIGIPSAQVELVVNATGCSQCRPHFRSSFMSYFRTRGTRLCRTCRRYLKRAPTRVLACEEEKCRTITRHAPQILDFLCESCKKHLRSILEFLDETRIPYFLDTRLFREGSWFQHFIFEMKCDARMSIVEGLGWESTPLADLSGQEHADFLLAQPGVDRSGKEIDGHDEGSAAQSGRRKLLIAEGGRVSGAGELITGKWVDAVSGVLFVSGLAFAMRENAVNPAVIHQEKVFLAQLGELARRKSLVLMEVLRHGGINVIESLGRDSVKSQLNVAQKVGAKIALILGQKEALDKTVIVREVDSGMQETVPQEKLIPFLRRRLEKGSVQTEPFK